jgi:hypothetical protein
MKRRVGHAESNARIRGDILLYVRASGDIGATLQFIAQVFLMVARDWAVDALEENCGYLVDRGYLSQEHVRDDSSNIERWIYRLTTKGFELLERTIPPDPEVSIVY